MDTQIIAYSNLEYKPDGHPRRQMLRSGQTGRPVPCTSCASVCLKGDSCAGCGIRRLDLEPKQLSLFPPEPKPKGAIDLKIPCQCGSKLAKPGAGRGPNEQSLHCCACKKFICYQPIGQLKNRQKPGLEHISEILARLEFGGEG